MPVNRVDSVSMPRKIAALPRDARGFPVPWFVVWRDGEPSFPTIDMDKWRRALNQHLCWVCGTALMTQVAFTIGPMCIINRISSEPPSHPGCADYAARVCPFLANPRMRRVPPAVRPDTIAPPGLHIEENPGGCVVYITSKAHHRVFYAVNGPLIRFRDPREVHWFTEGRAATDQEAADLFMRGASRLLTIAALEGERAIAELVQQIVAARKHLPDPALVTEIKEAAA